MRVNQIIGIGLLAVIAIVVFLVSFGSDGSELDLNDRDLDLNNPADHADLP